MITKIVMTRKFFKKGHTLEESWVLASVAVDGFQARVLK